ncbi:MAG: cysteine-rich small domain-containing protein [Clostridiales bacterium]|nr:cysteine-rich small domain-containing protein [Clostridiales bacterium]
MEMKTTNYKFFQHKDCEFFPCHQGIEEEKFNCLFCYCPLFALGDECGGNFSYDNEHGIKDCSGCLVPHQKGNYEYITKKLGILIERTKKTPAEDSAE